MIVSEKIGRKAQRLVDDERVTATSEVAIVSGDSGFHRVIAQNDRVWCDCPAWKPDRYCSHAIAAMIAWNERAS